MRLSLIVAVVFALSAAGDAAAAGRFGNSSSSRTYSSSSSDNSFLYRGHNPGHIFGNTVRRIYWGPSMGPGR
jgi:hypothetical protein